MTTKPKALTPREAQFVREYLIDKSGTHAAIRAGYSERSARKTAYEMLQKPHIKAYVNKELKAQAERTLITADQVLLDLQRIAQKAEKAQEYAAATRALELLGKRYRLFTEKHEHSGPGGTPIEFTEVRRTIVDPSTRIE